MNPYKSIVRDKFHAIAKNANVSRSLLTVPIVASGCSVIPAHEKEVSYHNPPVVRSILQPRYGRVRCMERSAATAMALTGFFADGCVKLAQADRWQVVSVSFSDLGNGQTLWLAEIRDLNNIDSNTLWSPLPWHDWA